MEPIKKACPSNLSSTLLAFILLAALSSLGTNAAAQQEKVISESGSGTGVIFDSAGNLYGANSNEIYELSPQAGLWKQTILYSFTTDEEPLCNLVFDSASNLYGVTISGRNGDLGTVFELKNSGSGTWTEETLFTFPLGGKLGGSPYGSLIFDAAGNLYGTTFYGGAYGLTSQNTGGTVFELVHRSDGGWAEKVLHSFGNGSDGIEPYANLIFDAAGNLYGTTTHGGAYGAGIAFELMPQAGGGWREKILHNFGNGSDGQFPYTGLTLDASGNLYGSTTNGGTYNGGTAFELIPQAGGGWKEKILHHFGNTGDGSYVSSALIFDSAGNAYGNTFFGGAYSGGIVFELTPHSNGAWSEKILHAFGNGSDGWGALSNVTFGPSGNLFGTTQSGGTSEGGIVWEVIH